ADARVRSAYLGELAPPAAASGTPQQAEPKAEAEAEAEADEVLLTVRDLQVKYGNAVALDGMSLTAARGGVTALLGSNGAGKSTLARALAGLVPACAGTIP